MKAKRTKMLNEALEKGFIVASENNGGNPVDIALNILITECNNHAAHILNIFLKDWEIAHINKKIKEELKDSNNAFALGSSFEENLDNALVNISKEFTENRESLINSSHLLLYVVRNKNFVASRILGMYNITPEVVADRLSDYPLNEDYYDDMNALRSIDKLKVTLKLPSVNDDEHFDDILAESGVEDLSKSEFMAKFGTDLTNEAREGKLDGVIGREKEINRLIEILGRRKKNNPIIIGEAGVGKSAIVEGLAVKIANGEVPFALRDKSVFSLDMASLVAGSKYRGEFEERVKKLVDILRENKDVILFIDEIHTIVDAGSSQGGLDASNILKPALTKGEVQCIGATTVDEYREKIEKDGALERRFQKIIVTPSSKSETLDILRKIKGHYENHHGVKYTDYALKTCVELTERYITNRHFPDKAIDVIDEAGSKASLQIKNQSGCKVVDSVHIQEVVSTMTGIPVQDISTEDKQKLKTMFSHLQSSVVGQQSAVGKITSAIQRAKAGLKDPDKPIGVFMFVGPTGVGKTLLAKELSKWMFGSSGDMVRVDMSEYSEKHNISRLIGSPPGYVGYGEGGFLTEAVRRQPYSVILFDEIEKAHSDVFNIMLQIFDEGTLTDGLGRKIDFRNTIIIMTSNAGAQKIASFGEPIGYETNMSTSTERSSVANDYIKALEGEFTPEFINRIDHIITFNSLSEEDIRQIVDLELSMLRKRVVPLGYYISATDAAREKLASLGFEPRYGVRSLKRVIMEHIEEPLAEMIVRDEINTGDQVEIGLSRDSIVVRRKTEKAKRLTSVKVG